MLERLDEWVSIPTLLWLFPIVFMLHDFEEIIFIEAWTRKNSVAVLDRVPARFRRIFQRVTDMTSAQFAVAVMLEFIVFIPITYAAAEKGIYYLFLSCNAILLLHALTHVGQSVILGRYTPGVVTVVTIVPVYTLYLFDRMMDEGLIRFADILWSIPAGLLVVPLVLFGHQLGRWVVPKG
jgi:hypothetical protein